MNTEEFYKHVYRLSFITRYTNYPRIRNEDVAQHSFFVSAIILSLHDIYDFNLGMALQAAVSHDITESDLSDVTHAIKRSHPRLAKEIKIAEDIELRKYPLAVHEGVSIFEDESSIAGRIANYADVLQVRQYVLTEISLGNTTMNSIKTETMNRLHVLEKELEKYERNR